MQFVITAYDGVGLLARRMEVRPRHMEFKDRDELDAYLAQEPYVTEHVWDRIEVERMNVVLLDREFVQKV